MATEILSSGSPYSESWGPLLLELEALPRDDRRFCKPYEAQYLHSSERSIVEVYVKGINA
jgi:hypothetical protein